MPLFNEATPSGEEMAALLLSRTILSTCSVTQELLEVSTAAAAKALIIPGPDDPPFDGQAYTVMELENRIAYGQIHPPTDEDNFEVARSRAVGAVSEKEGFFRLHWRRVVRQSEYHAPNGRRDVWLYFTDRTSRICEEFIEAADLNLWSMRIRRKKVPMFNPKEDHAAQGIYIWADFRIYWGGSENSDQ